MENFRPLPNTCCQVEGIATIRAFNWQQSAEYRNAHDLDQSQRPFYILLCLQRWLNIVLDLVVGAIAIGIITIAVILQGTTTGSQIGVALNLIIVANTTLIRLVESWTTLEISLGAIARLKSVELHTPQEEQLGETFLPAPAWPAAGVLKMNNVVAAYK